MRKKKASKPSEIQSRTESDSGCALGPTTIAAFITPSYNG
jgi:hypothetical protein